MQRSILALSIFFSVFFANPLLAAPNLQPLIGKTVPLQALHGKWVFINYWANWCHPCLEEIPALNAFYKKNKNKVALYALHWDPLPPADLAALVHQYGLTYPSLKTDPGPALGIEELQGVPATIVLTPQGKLKTILYGAQTLASLEEELSS
ncbi:MAG: TlpA disulfide reductase family protein [Legionellaceae bacterium]|nr:TlpA disulfide reductase family protein [Legionellaceae bacterium]